MIICTKRDTRLKTMLKKLLIIFLAVLLAVSLCACDKESGEVNADNSGPAVKKSANGGTEGMENVNLFAVKADKNGQNTVLELDFYIGSRIGGDAEEKPAESVPHYEAYFTDAPSRLVIKLDGVKHSDYTYNTAINADSDVYGIFHYAFEGGTYLYVQLKNDQAIDVSEDGGRLKVTLAPYQRQTGADDSGTESDIVIGASDTDKYYCVSTAFTAYKEGRLEGDMTPVLSGDLKTVLLISEGFVYESDAQRYKQDMLKKNPTTSEEEWGTLMISGNELPAMEQTVDISTVYDRNIIRVGGVEKPLPLFIGSGIYLCDNPNNGGYIFSRKSSEITGDEYNYEELWTVDADGNERRVLEFEFYTVEQAEFSPNGRKIAILERTQEDANLYIFDALSWELISNLSGAGFGNSISRFTWDEFGARFFAMSGSSEMKIREYDFTVPKSSARHSVIVDENIDEGSLCFSNGMLYYTYSNMEEGSWIYRVMPDGGECVKFMRGSAVELSPNRRYMAISLAGDYSEDAFTDGFILYDMTTGESRQIETGFTVHDFNWTMDSQRLYFFENRLSGDDGEGAAGETEENNNVGTDEQDPYPYTLWAYDVETGEMTNIADTVSTTIALGGDADIVYLFHYVQAGSSNAIRATYVFDITK